MALQIIDYASHEYRQMLDLRHQILRAPLGLSFREEDIEQDKNNILIGAFEDGKMLGCCMLVKEGEMLLLRQMAVLNDLQGKGIGRALLHFAEAITRDIGYRELNMYARKSVSGFYIRMGYIQIGEEFIKVTIPHVLMKKD
ncbi:MAG: GNAT family N-acetyltransferase [Sphingobacteriales bacterium]|nr:GNAT family N-acetyltransferase [Sphingobacteriales bacterium]